MHYLGDTEGPFELYEPYPNANCLHCHDDARGFVEATPHHGQLEALRKNETSCLSCHSSGHAHQQVDEGNLWLQE